MKPYVYPVARIATQAVFPGGFAVLMPVYLRDDPCLFELAVDSVFSNTLPPTQFVLVVDGPLSFGLEQKLLALIRRHGALIEVLRLPRNVGAAHARNAGLAHTGLPWVVNADADDFNLPHRFAALAALLVKQPELVLFGSAVLEVDNSGCPTAIRAVPTSETEIRNFVKFRNPFNGMSVAYRRELALACGGFPDVHLREDYALWCRMLSHDIRVANTAEVLVRASAGLAMYRRRGGWRYAKAEWELQNLMVICGLKTKGRAWRDGFIRAAGFLAPAALRGKLYEMFLRKAAVKF